MVSTTGLFLGSHNEYYVNLLGLVVPNTAAGSRSRTVRVATGSPLPASGSEKEIRLL